MGALGRLGAPLLGLAAALALHVAGRGLDEVAREGQLGPGFWPRAVLIGLALACVAKLVQGWRAPAGPPAVDRPELSTPKLVAGLASIAGSVAAAPVLGFPLATALFVAGFMLLGGTRSAAGIIAAAGLGTVALLYLFVKVVYLPLPKGDGPFEALTLALYRALRIF
jgi:putative tricarboxylic transport membrane protein